MPSIKQAAEALAATNVSAQAKPQAPAKPAGPEARWEECMQFFRDNLASQPEMFRSWFSPITFMGCEGNELNLRVPSSFFKDQLELRYLRLIAAGVMKCFGPDTRLFYHFPKPGAGADDIETTVRLTPANPSPAAAAGPDAVSNPFSQAAPEAEELDPQLNPYYTFENYCEGATNRLAVSIGKAIADNPRQKTFSPFFVFGPTGVGKTHLIHAIGLRSRERQGSKRRVLHVTARLFESQYTTAVNDGRVNDFIRFYQSIETLIIDDIQDLAGNKKATQNAFFHIFNHLHQNGRQLILSSDCRPSELTGLEERLLSRFKWGATVEIERPDRALRMAFLRQRVEQDGLDIPQEVLDCLADNITDSIRELEGAMVSLLAHATALNLDIDLPLARRVAANAVNMQRRQINFEMIAQAVSEHYGLAPDLIFARRRSRDIADARQVVMYLARKHTDLSLAAIGARLQKNHATVIHGAKAIHDRLAQDHEKQLRADIAAIEQALMPPRRG